MEEALKPWVISQAVMTLVLVMLLRVLHEYVQRQEFFRWWTLGWGCFGVWLLVGTAQLQFARTRPWLQFVLLTLATVAAYLQPLAFLLGARSLRYPVRFRVWMPLVVGAAAMLVCVISANSSNPLRAFMVRNLPRQVMLVLAYTYSAVVIFVWARRESRPAAVAISAGCLAYAFVQVWTLLAYVGTRQPGLSSARTTASFLLSYACQASIIVGMMLLLLERNKATQKKLLLYEAIVPTCCVCGDVRDDCSTAGPRGEWMHLHDYVGRHAGARFSHTFCPKCLVDYRRREGLPVPGDDMAAVS